MSSANALRAGGADQRGFTLIEASIAMLVLTVAVLGVASLFVYAVNYNAGGVIRKIALTVGQHHVERLRNLPFDDPQLAATGMAPVTQTVTRSGGTFTVATTIVASPGSAPLPNTSTKRKTITVVVTPLGGEGWSAAPVRIVTTRAALTLGPYRQ